MKVLMVSNFFPPHWGGIEINAYQIAKNLVKRGIKVKVIAGGKRRSRERMDGIEVVRLPLAAKVSSAVIPKGMTKEIEKGGFDIIHIHEPNPAMSAVVWEYLKRHPKPLYVTYHSDIVKTGPHTWLMKKMYVNAIQKKLFRKATTIFATSPRYVEISDVLPEFRNKIVIAPNGVELKKFQKKRNGRRIRKRHGLGGKKVILFVGRLIPYKGLQILIEALPQIRKKVKGATLLVVGEGPKKEEWKNRAKELGVASSIVWAGRASDSELVDYYDSCDVFVLPSIYKTEAFGIVLLEAMACGKPCVTTDVSGTAYVVEDAGIAVKTGDPGELGKAVVKVLTSPKLAREMKKKGLERVKQFTWEKIARTIEKEYRKG